MSETQSKATDSRPSELRSIARSIEYAFPTAAEVLRGIARELAADQPCEITTDGWCATHSTSLGPVYCGSSDE